MALPYILNNGNLSKFLSDIQSAAVPSKVDYRYLQSRGYTGKNDQYLVAFLNLGFIGSDGSPLERWHDHRHSDQAKRVRGEAAREAYRGFFELYSDAERRTEVDFANWARAENPKASPVTLKRAWSTFRTIVSLSEFKVEPHEDGNVEQGEGGRENAGDSDAPPPRAAHSSSET
jgi:hypothetical protein